MTNSDTSFPRVKAFQSQFGGGAEDAFVAKLNRTGSGLEYSTFLGGSGQGWAEGGYGIAVDSMSNAHVTGVTNSPDFPHPNAWQSTPGGGVDAFVTTFDSTGSALLYSTFWGGSDEDQARGITVDRIGNTYITGSTKSDKLASSASVVQATRSPSASDAFVAKFSATGTREYATYLGSADEDSGYVVGEDA